MLIKGRAKKGFLRVRKINRSRGNRVSDGREVDTSTGDTSAQYLRGAPVLLRLGEEAEKAGAHGSRIYFRGAPTGQ